MRIFKFFLSLVVTIALIYLLSNRFVVKDNPIPPLGNFLDPFHGFWANAESTAFPYPEEINIEGLNAPVKVQYDSIAIPHIFASNNEDLFRAQGYILAQHRLWQMEFQTFAASGRLSELIGANAIDFDKLQRRKGMVYGAENSLESMKKDEELWRYIESYTAGVNSYIESLSYEDYPLEYKLLGYKPEPWTPLKSALLLQYMIDNLTGWDKDLQNTNAYNLFGKKIFKQLYPNYPNNFDPIVPSPDDWGFKNIITPKTPDSLAFHKTYVSTVHDMPDPDNGSNNWAVAGWKTKNGNPILASDMHLGLNLPSLWFMIELSAPEYNVMGFALAGNVGVVSGFNANNAWAFTDVARDERDWYKIQFTDESREEYIFEDTKMRSNTKIEEIKVRDGKTVYDTVVYTHHGPVVYDRNFLSDNHQENLAMKWIGHFPSRVQEALIDLNRSSNYDEYVTALKNWDAPSQHVAFASTNGDIAIRVQGLWPNKFKDQGLYIMDGSKKALEWQGFIPTDQYAYQYNPNRGFVSSANQHSVDQNYPYWQGWASTDFYRGRRINNILRSYDSASISIKDMMDLQQDSYGIMPEEVLPLLLDSLKSNNKSVISDSLFASLNKWDYTYKVEKIAPAVFIEWWDAFMNLLWDEMSNSNIALNQPTDFQTISLLKNGIPIQFIDNKSTVKKENINDLILMSYDSMKSSLQKWDDENKEPFNWGNYKHTSVIHLARINALSRLNVQVNGQRYTVNSTKANHGPSQRIVVEMTSPPTAYAIIPGGQSGNPGNPTYDNMINMWRDGEYLKLDFMQKESSKKSIIFSQTLSSDQK